MTNEYGRWDEPEWPDGMDRVHMAVDTMYAQLDKHEATSPRRNVRLIGLYLGKYFEAQQMHEQFAHSAHVEGRHAEARDHLKNLNDTLAAAHQVLHYNFGADDPITKNFVKNRDIVSNHITDYSESNP